MTCVDGNSQERVGGRNGERRWGLAAAEDLAGQREEGDFAATTQMKKAQKQEGQAAWLLGKLSKHRS